LNRARSIRSKNVNGWFHTDPSSPVAATYISFPLDMHDWSCGQWKSYYIANVQHLGKTKAMEIFEFDASQQGYFSDFGDCKYECDFMDYLRNEGFEVHSFWGTAYCGIGEAAETAGEYASVAAAGVSTLFLIGGGVLAFILLKKAK